MSLHILLFHEYPIFHHAPAPFDFVVGLGNAIFYLQAVLCGEDSQHDYTIADAVGYTAARCRLNSAMSP